jgi:hypothetical protein
VQRLRVAEEQSSRGSVAQRSSCAEVEVQSCRVQVQRIRGAEVQMMCWCRGAGAGIRGTEVRGAEVV